MKLVALILSLALLIVSFTVPAAEPSPRIAELQAGLAELGYDAGPVDGLLGRKTREAIMAFQKDQKLIVDGEYSDFLSRRVDLERERAPRRRALLAMSDDELIELIERASADEAERISWLIPERYLSLPVSLTFGKWFPPDAGELAFSIALRQLLYPPAPEGVEQFQADIGAEKTGELTGRQFMELSRRWVRQRDTPVSVRGAEDVHIDDDWGRASAGGTWVSENQESGSPVNSSKITCDRARRECLRVHAELRIPSLDDDGNDGSYYLNVWPVQRYSIVSWENGEIVARDTGACTISLLTLNRNSNEIYEIVRNNDGTPECQNPKLPRITRLMSDWATTLAATREFWRKRQEVTNSYLNARATEEMKQALGATEPLGLPGPAIGPPDGTQ